MSSTKKNISTKKNERKKIYFHSHDVYRLPSFVIREFHRFVCCLTQLQLFTSAVMHTVNKSIRETMAPTTNARCINWSTITALHIFCALIFNTYFYSFFSRFCRRRFVLIFFLFAFIVHIMLSTNVETFL